ncbi:MAG TPA: 5-formyltetrahydrofolate cyclo-ligase [Ghiorsea sp.]|nr:5-formyltetrahydrofolate cyclo-ligase [Ghiorsea sp.]HIP07241.1 5-formyltetrahydrofolate cyclo-ligase [Mariprofundaceae bacterium]
MSDISSLKQQLRKELRAKRNQLSSDDYVQFSHEICAQVIDYLNAKQVKQLLVYKALPEEVNTDNLLRLDGIEVFVPRMLADCDMLWVKLSVDTQWHTVGFGVKEPVAGEIWQPSATSAVLVCPLLGFDESGQRLGMGKGYFDRWLSKYGSDVDAIGVAFACQALSKVPVEPHDVPLATIITEKGIISCPTT